jgi:hypothetical protein
MGNMKIGNGRLQQVVAPYSKKSLDEYALHPH